MINDWCSAWATGAGRRRIGGRRVRRLEAGLEQEAQEHEELTYPGKVLDTQPPGKCSGPPSPSHPPASRPLCRRASLPASGAEGKARGTRRNPDRLYSQRSPQPCAQLAKIPGDILRLAHRVSTSPLDSMVMARLQRQAAQQTKVQTFNGIHWRGARALSLSLVFPQ